jgi:hypothetical protein
MQVFRQANHVVDALAKHGLNLDLHLNVFDVIPDFFSQSLLSDSAGVSFPKLILVYFESLAPFI